MSGLITTIEVRKRNYNKSKEKGENHAFPGLAIIFT